MIRRNLMFDKVSCLYLMQKIVSRISYPADISFLGSNVKLFCPSIACLSRRTAPTLHRT